MAPSPFFGDKNVVQVKLTRDMNKISKVVLYLLLATTIAYLVNSVPVLWLEKITASLSSHVLTFFGLSSTWNIKGSCAYIQVIDGMRSLTINIVRECTGIHVFAIILGLILPTKGKWRKKMFAISLASIMLFLLNISRICLTVGLTFFDIFPFSMIFTSPLVEAYHYPLSFLYGVFGVFLIIICVDRFVLPELGNTLIEVVAVAKIALYKGKRLFMRVRPFLKFKSIRH